MKVIDLTYLNSISDADDELINSLIEIFLQQLQEFCQLFDESYAQRDWWEVAAIAHKAKSSILSMGMKELGYAMTQLEMLGKALYLDEETEHPDEYRRADCMHKLANLPEDIAVWLAQNKSDDEVGRLINFYKLQANLATADLQEASAAAKK